MKEIISKMLLVITIFLITAGCTKEKNEAVNANVPVAADDKTNTLIFVSDPYPPYVIDGEFDKGYVTDMTLLIFKKAGLKAEYQNVPFSRALAGLENGTYTGLLAVSPGRENFVYPDNSMGDAKNDFFIRKDFNWKWDGLASFNNVIFGAIADYEINEEIIDPYINANKENLKRVQLVFGSNALKSNILKLVNSRIDVIFDDELVVIYTAREIGVADKIKIAEVDKKVSGSSLFEPSKMCVGFNLNNPKATEYAQILSNGIAEIKKTGEFKQILMKYGLEEHVK